MKNDQHCNASQSRLLIEPSEGEDSGWKIMLRKNLNNFGVFLKRFI